MCGGKKATKKSCHTSGPTMTVIFEMFKVRYMQSLVKSDNAFEVRREFSQIFWINPFNIVPYLKLFSQFFTVLDKIRLFLNLFFMMQYHCSTSNIIVLSQKAVFTVFEISEGNSYCRFVIIIPLALIFRPHGLLIHSPFGLEE